MEKSQCKSVFVLVLVVTLAACQERARLSIDPGSTIDNLHFVLSAWSEQASGGLEEVDVYRCIVHGSKFPETGERIWAASVKAGGKPPVVGRFGYGQEIPGLVVSQKPKQLEPGCYIARTYSVFPDPRIGVLIFRISSDGKITSEGNT